MIRIQARSHCNTRKRKMLSKETMTSSEACNTTKRRKLPNRRLISSKELHTSKRKRLSEDKTTSSEVCNIRKRRKLPHSSSTCKRRSVSDTSTVPSKRRKLSSQLCTNTSATTKPNWLGLPPELLQLIFEKLPAADTIRFAASCKSWKKAAISSPLLQRPPMFMLPSVDKEQDMSSRPFFCSAEKKIYTINNELPNDEPVLSSHGWLLMNKQDTMTYLLNPLSRARIELPELPRLNATDHWRIRKAAISSDPSDDKNFIVVILLNLWPVTRMMFLKYGVNTWTDLGSLPEMSTINADIMFYEEQLYVVSNDLIEVWDFRAKSYPTKTSFQISGLEIDNTSEMIWTYTVVSEGEILFVKRVSRQHYDDFHLYRLVGTEWEKVKSLMGHALFLCENPSTMISFSTRNFPTFEGNSIYVVEIHTKSDHPMVTFKVLQHNLEDKGFKNCKEFKVKKRNYYPPCIWFSPNIVLHSEKKHKSSKSDVD